MTGLRRFGATREETLVVEDSSRGLSSAVAAGIDCAVVAHDFTSTQDFSRARYRIKTLGELRDIVLAATGGGAVRSRTGARINDSRQTITRAPAGRATVEP